MRIGVAREIKSDEYRVALTPAGALRARAAWPRGAGRGRRGGRQCLPERGLCCRGRPGLLAWTRSGKRQNSLLKVKEPIAAEYGRLRRGSRAVHVPASGRRRVAHARARRERRRCGGVRDGGDSTTARLPLLAPMSRGSRPARDPDGRVRSRSRRVGGASCSAECRACRRRRWSSSGAGSSVTTRRSSRSG